MMTESEKLEQSDAVENNFKKWTHHSDSFVNKKKKVEKKSLKALESNSH